MPQLVLAVLIVLVCHGVARGQDGRAIIDALFQAAREAPQRARKIKPVDARPATLGEVIVTIIAGEGEETRSPPAIAGDMVVRNRCPQTGNEEILVKADAFAARYEGPLAQPASDDAIWKPFRPRGKEMLVVVVPASQSAFTFTAPWGSTMVARPGDAILRDPANPADTYRIARASFDCTYEVLEPGR